MDQVQGVQLRVAGVANVALVGDLAASASDDVALAKGVVGQLLDQVAVGVGQRVHAAEVVVGQVLPLIPLARGPRHDRHHAGGGREVVFVGVGAAADPVFKQAAGRVDGGHLAGAVAGLLQFLAVGAVYECGPSAASVQPCRQVVAGPGVDAAAGLGGVAVGVIAVAVAASQADRMCPDAAVLVAANPGLARDVAQAVVANVQRSVRDGSAYVSM